MASRQDVLVLHFQRYLYRHMTGFKTLSDIEQRRVTSWIWNADSRRKAHSEHQGYMSISYQEIYQHIGRERFKEINSMLNLFDDIKEAHFKKGGPGYTRAYLLSDASRDIKKQYLNTSRIWYTNLVDVQNGTRITKPARGLASKNSNGREPFLWADVKDQLPNRVEVGLDTLKVWRKLALKAPNNEQFCLMLRGQPDAEKTAFIAEHLSKLIRMANTKAAGRGYVLTKYTEIESGRLYAVGADNLQTVPRLIRIAALNRLWDVDIENCHYSIFAQMAERFGVNCIAISDYLAHKKPTRERIAKDIGVGVDGAKDCLIAMIYGASTGVEWWDGDRKRQGAIAKNIGPDAARLFFDHPVVKALFADIRKGRKAILAGWHRRGKSLINDADKSARTDMLSDEQQLAHLLQGAEALMLREAFRLHADSIVLLQHDGFTSSRPLRPEELRRLEMEIHARTGYRIEMKQERLQIDADLDFRKV